MYIRIEPKTYLLEMYRHRSSDKITFFTVKMERKATCLLAFASELGYRKKESTIIIIFCTYFVFKYMIRFQYSHANSIR